MATVLIVGWRWLASFFVRKTLLGIIQRPSARGFLLTTCSTRSVYEMNRTNCPEADQSNSISDPKPMRSDVFDTAIGAGTVGDDGLQCAMSCTRYLTSIFLSAREVARGSAHPARSTEASHGQRNPTSRIAGTAVTSCNTYMTNYYLPGM